MITIIEGKISPVNEHYLEDIKRNYISNYTTVYPLLDYALKRTAKLTRPVLGSRYLCIIKEDFDQRKFKAKLPTLLNQKDNSFVDYVLCLPYKCNTKNMYIEDVAIININKTYREDFKLFVINALKPTEILSKEDLTFLANRIKYNYEKFMLYLPKLKETNLLTMKVIKDVIIDKPLDNLNTVLVGIVNRNSKTLGAYYDYEIKYSATWLRRYTLDTLHSVIKYKIQVMKGTLKLYDITSRDRTKALRDLIYQTNILDVYNCIRTLEHYQPIESYFALDKRYYLQPSLVNLDGLLQPAIKPLF